MPAATLPSSLASVKPDVCFNALHGRWGEDGCVQGLLEAQAASRYPHSGVLSLRSRHAQGGAPAR